jgi:hypothetical protein
VEATKITSSMLFPPCVGLNLSTLLAAKHSAGIMSTRKLLNGCRPARRKDGNHLCGLPAWRSLPKRRAESQSDCRLAPGASDLAPFPRELRQDVQEKTVCCHEYR